MEEEEEAQVPADHHHTEAIVVVIIVAAVDIMVMEIAISCLEWAGIKLIILMLITVIIHAKIAGLLIQNA